MLHIRSKKKLIPRRASCAASLQFNSRKQLFLPILYEQVRNKEMILQQDQIEF
jgi:hypothetical protein